MKIYPEFEQGLHYEALHEDYKNWLNELHFNSHEIDFFQKSLGDFAMVQQDKSTAPAIEQYENKLILQREQNDIFLHDLKEQQKKLNDFIKSHESNIEFINFSDHKDWRERMRTHRKLYQEMKTEFYQTFTIRKKL